jgi:hypothetical protein
MDHSLRGMIHYASGRVGTPTSSMCGSSIEGEGQARDSHRRSPASPRHSLAASSSLSRPEAADLAKCGLPHAFFCRGISLNVNSSLYAVGVLAAVSDALAKAVMSINIVSAYHRDSIFVASARADEAVALLKKLGMKK